MYLIWLKKNKKSLRESSYSGWLISEPVILFLVDCMTCIYIFTLFLCRSENHLLIDTVSSEFLFDLEFFYGGQDDFLYEDDHPHQTTNNNNNTNPNNTTAPNNSSNNNASPVSPSAPNNSSNQIPNSSPSNITTPPNDNTKSTNSNNSPATPPTSQPPDNSNNAMMMAMKDVGSKVDLHEPPKIPSVSLLDEYVEFGGTALELTTIIFEKILSFYLVS